MAVLAALVALLVVGNAAWISQHRIDSAVDVDEHNLLNQGVAVRSSLARHGLAAIVRPDRYLSPSPVTAPGVPVATALSLQLAGRSLLAAMVPILASLAVLVVAAWAIERQLGAGPWALLGAAVVGLAPVTSWFARVHHLIIPGAACLAVCVAIGLRTRRLERRGWSIALGAAIGVALLVRTMLVAIVPWILLGWVAVFLLRRRATRAQVANLALAALASVLVAAWWWVPNGAETVDYLRHGPVTSDSAPWWNVGLELQRLGTVVTGHDTPVSAWLAGVAAVVLFGVALAANVGRRWLTAEDAYVAVVVAGTLAALVLARDDFPGFSLLVAGVAIPWAVSVAARTPWPGVRVASLGLWSCVAAFGLVRFPAADTGWYQVRSEETHITGGIDGRGWSDVYAAVLGAAADATPEGCEARLVLPQGDDLIATGFFRWAEVVGRGGPEPVEVGYDRWEGLDLEQQAQLAADEGATVALITAGDFSEVDDGDARDALRAAGYEEQTTVETPDGRDLEVWRPPGC